MKSNLTVYLPIALMLMAICGLAVAGRAHIANLQPNPKAEEKPEESDHAETSALISPQGHQPIKASVEDATPSHFTINVKKMANIGVNEEAKTFAVYTSSSPPAQCGDFRELELTYEKPSKYERVFNLEGHQDVLDAIDQHKCVVIRNIPPKG